MWKAGNPLAHLNRKLKARRAAAVRRRQRSESRLKQMKYRKRGSSTSHGRFQLQKQQRKGPCIVSRARHAAT